MRLFLISLGLRFLFSHLARFISLSPFYTAISREQPRIEATVQTPGGRVRYLAEIVENNRRYNNWVLEQSAIAERCYVLEEAAKALPESLPLTRPC